MSQPSAATQLYAATSQIAKANLPWVAGGLSRFEDAEDRELFATAPVDDGGAYRHAAYWQAVASRLLASSELLSAAVDAERKAMSVSLLSFGDSNVSKILRDASQNVSRAVAMASNSNEGTRADTTRVQSLLAQYAAPSAIELSQRSDDSYTGWLRQWQKSLQSAGRIAAFAGVALAAAALGALVWFASRKWTSVRRNTGRVVKVAGAAARTVKRLVQVGAA